MDMGTGRSWLSSFGRAHVSIKQTRYPPHEPALSRPVYSGPSSDVTDAAGNAALRFKRENGGWIGWNGRLVRIALRWSRGRPALRVVASRPGSVRRFPARRRLRYRLRRAWPAAWLGTRLGLVLVLAMGTVPAALATTRPGATSPSSARQAPGPSRCPDIADRMSVAPSA